MKCFTMPIFYVLGFLSMPALTIGARILGIICTPSISHQIVFRPIWRALSLRGHQVVLITTDPTNDPNLANLTEIDLHDGSYETLARTNFADLWQLSFSQLLDESVEVFGRMWEYQLSHPDVQALIRNGNEHFDVVLVETMNPHMVMFAERFKCPLILVSSLDSHDAIHELMGNPTHPIFYPDFMPPFVQNMTFFERLTNIMYSLLVKYYTYNKFEPLQQKLIDKYFGQDYPPLQEVMKNISLVFVNTNPIFNQDRPIVPAMISIGDGLHINDPKPLPERLQAYLDEAHEGFVYFSLGSNVQGKELALNKRKIILETLSELPYKVLWKFELDQLPGKPDNVFISKWFPQQDIFRHPNIKLFVSQGGLQSIQEAIHNKIPMVVMPFFGDQTSNANRVVAKGFGLTVDYRTLQKESFKEAILEVIDNSKYRDKIEKLSDLAKDQQTSGLERAVWWTEYTIRHKDVNHLKGAGVKIPLYQYLFLDIIGFVVFILVVVIAVFLLLIKTVVKLSTKSTTKLHSKTD